MQFSQWFPSALFGVLITIIFILIRRMFKQADIRNTELAERMCGHDERISEAEKTLVGTVTAGDCEEKRDKIMKGIDNMREDLHCFEIKMTRTLGEIHRKSDAVIDVVNKLNNKK